MRCPRLPVPTVTAGITSVAIQMATALTTIFMMIERTTRHPGTAPDRSPDRVVAPRADLEGGRPVGKGCVCQNDVCCPALGGSAHSFQGGCPSACPPPSQRARPYPPTGRRHEGRLRNRLLSLFRR